LKCQCVWAGFCKDTRTRIDDENDDDDDDVVDGVGHSMSA